MSLQTSPQIISHPDDEAKVKRIWKAFWVLLILTILELGCGLLIYQLDKGDPSHMLILFIKGVIVVFTIFKAFYIISIFMHLGDEIRSMILTVAIPMTLFIWFIIAFLADGASFRNNRNTDAGSRKYEEVHIRHQPLNIPPGTKKVTKGHLD